MITVCVLFGGASSEHEVSLMSVTSVLNNIDREKYDVVPVGITRDGRWLRYRGPVDLIESGKWESSGETVPALLSPDRGHKGLLELTDAGAVPVPVDVVFPVLHGKNGEDGTIQGLLSLADIPCVGCGVLSSAVCMDKDVSHTLLLAAGVPKTRMVALTREDTRDFDALEQDLRERLGYPMFVKPANAGSSVGVTKAKNAVELRDGLSLAFTHDRKIVVEQQLAGREVECAVIGNGDPVAAQILGEIAPQNEFYDYEGKYIDGTTDLIVPARLGEETARELREIAVRAYRALECRGLSRVDFFVSDDGKVTLNEINTMPGFTSISMHPRLFVESGVPYPDLIDRLIQYALE